MIQLEQANVLTEDSESLMREMAMELQRTLKKVMKKVVVGTAAVSELRKSLRLVGMDGGELAMLVVS
ncbi:hypothetical protein PC129_g8159 [Phytophthora cactorum]|uniref:Uncharacterized protein n=1 Tax=Phytophthora cactorum TaxID=29920 RepID=A0A329RNY0_9STRA|nr:hypothetical protein Pcac1_g27768 [Phytophthora cactorum]KAG2824491.1 hypothetical protein PC112_g10098 [Phytophthora cactorum]KAG2826705.1 hypothetical protein PC111_g8876 [Phytophthora cactorum]KAG2857782.1 hypothetical protein PC113_g10382 [Phytophthora cactorum]KAG2907040.1 hypothetical protein PC114_g10945 [Phytophthora cactorum]